MKMCCLRSKQEKEEKKKRMLFILSEREKKKFCVCVCNRDSHSLFCLFSVDLFTFSKLSR